MTSEQISDHGSMSSQHDASHFQQSNTEKTLDNDNEPTRTTESEADDDDEKYLTGPRLILVTVSLCLATLLVALDSTILATAVPTITKYFDSLEDTAWYEAHPMLETISNNL